VNRDPRKIGAVFLAFAGVVGDASDDLRAGRSSGT
jgi:hypothetical protein